MVSERRIVTHDVEDRDRVVGDRDAVVRADEATERRWAFDASDAITLLAALGYLVLGLLAFIELGVDGYPSEETTSVANLTHTQLWASANLVLGLLFLIGVGGRGRTLSTFAGALAVVMGIVVVASHEEFDPVLATEAAYGWLALIVGAVVVIAAMAIPVVSTRRARHVEESMA